MAVVKCKESLLVDAATHGAAHGGWHRTARAEVRVSGEQQLEARYAPVVEEVRAGEQHSPPSLQQRPRVAHGTHADGAVGPAPRQALRQARVPVLGQHDVLFNARRSREHRVRPAPQHSLKLGAHIVSFFKSNLELPPLLPAPGAHLHLPRHFCMIRKILAPSHNFL